MKPVTVRLHRGHESEGGAARKVETWIRVGKGEGGMW